MKALINDYVVTIIDEPTYSRNSTDNYRTYQNDYISDNERWHSAALGIIVGDIVDPDFSSILLGVGGATHANEKSFVFRDDTLFLVCGDSLFSLDFPNLGLNWIKKADCATCFEVHLVANEDCLIIWGELAISRFDVQGNEIWSNTGPDIFSEKFEIKDGKINVSDFNGDEFVIDIKTGEMSSMS